MERKFKMVDKSKVKSAFIKVLEKKREKLRKSVEKTREEAIGAPSSRQTWYDTSRYQSSRLADNIGSLLEETERILNNLRTLRLDRVGEVALGSLVKIEDRLNRDVKYYLVVSIGGGESILVNGQEITMMSVVAPLARALMGEKEGEVINLGDNSFQILEIF